MKNKITCLALTISLLSPVGVYADPMLRMDVEPVISYDYARVIRVEPIIVQVNIHVPEQECRNREVVRVYDHRRGSVAGSTMAGGIFGGIIGNAIGRGRGRPLATIGGAILGATLAGTAAEHHNQRYGGGHEEVSTVRECRTLQGVRTEERVDGYQVEYEYRGQIYQAQMPYRPSDKIRVRVSVDPVAQ